MSIVHPGALSMANLLRPHRIAVAVALAVGLLATATAAVEAGTVSPASSSSSIGTPLPAGWELCILQGVSAPVTAQNVADLDEWQLAEGGSTDNTAAFNPYNTLRLTDVNDAPLPGTPSANGFPAFATWPAGCAATVATLLQANMVPIVAALRAGNISPPGAFLATVDESPWCAPSDGVPCYASQIAAATGSFDLTALLQSSSAVGLYGTVGNDLDAYVQDVAATSADQTLLQAATQDVFDAQNSVVGAQGALDDATAALRHLALDEYTGNGALSPDNALTLFEPGSDNDILAEQYDKIAASRLLDRFNDAKAGLAVAMARRDAASASMAKASSAVLAAQTAQDRALVRIAADQAALQAAGVCTSAPDVAPTLTLTTSSTAPGVPASASTGAPGSTAPAPAAAPNSASTTTTTTAPTTPASTTTTTTVPATGSPIPVPAPASSTTPASPPSTAGPAGVSALQGCVAALAPPKGS